MTDMRFSISGDWTEIAPGVHVRLQDAPNEEDMEHYVPDGAVILQVDISEAHERNRVTRPVFKDGAWHEEEC